MTSGITLFRMIQRYYIGIRYLIESIDRPPGIPRNGRKEDLKREMSMPWKPRSIILEWQARCFFMENA